MKKTIVALAALSAMAGAAHAQSSVTLYGVLDASVGYVKHPIAATATATNSSGTYVNDSAQTSSVWGMRGTEDLGGGLRANFRLLSDLRTDTGAGNADLFRREANVALVSADLGEIRLGRTMSPAIANGQGGIVTPSNSIGTSAAGAVGIGADFFTKNAVTYYSPNMAGVQGTLQYSFGENATISAASRKLAASLVYDSGPLHLGLAGEDVKGLDGETSRSWYNLNGMFTIDQFKIGAGFIRVIQGKSVTTSTAAAVAGSMLSDPDVGMAKPSSKGWEVSAGYQVTPATLVAATFYRLTPNDSTKTKSDQVNLQVRYALSKRSTVYAMVSEAKNGDTLFITPYYNAVTGVANLNQTAVAFGVIHAF